MGPSFPIGPTLMTAVAITTANIIVAWILVRAVGRGRGTDLSAETVGILVAVGLVCAAGAVLGWRSYLRRRRLS